jgi:serine/threonine protein phosphatase PrpC
MSPTLEHHTLVVAARGSGQDRAAVRDLGEELRVALADGAGGTGAGAKAADLVVAAATGTEARIEAARLLDQLEAAVAVTGGQATAVVLQVSGAGVRGASVGDSQAWVVRPGEVDELTRGQVRKPLVGAGCRPVAFAAPALGDGVLLVASDGLFSYAPGAEVLRIVRAGGELAAMAKALVELVRLRSGALTDDVSVVLVREAQVEYQAAR